MFRTVIKNTSCSRQFVRQSSALMNGARHSQLRSMASGIKDRERALEEAAARKHDAKLLADLAEKLKIQKGEKAQDSGKSISVVGAGLMGSGETK